ncbi:MAG: phosphoglucosamine mutase, partial [Chloroflexi bacterium]|nr:phosphoglucosamine mutase [Chloroflexota bacterium]
NNGAAFEIAPRVLRALGAQVIALHVEPDGVNINRGYDALEPKLLRETVLRARADWGVQFDGDGDRAVFVDARGNFVDGDFVLAIFARDFAARGWLKNNRVVSTVMANVGLEESLRAIGVELERTSVGDKWVTEKMRARGARIGGEQSGHIVLFDGGHTTGDGLYTTIRLAEILARNGAQLSELAACMQKYPQVLVNVRVPRKPPLDDFPRIRNQVSLSQNVLGDDARILLRYSGTENLARVMIEGPDAAVIAQEANAIARVIEETII